MKVDESLDSIRFRRNYLTSVLVRFDFAPILKLKDEISSDFQNNIRDKYPDIDYQTRIEHHIDIKNETMKKDLYKRWIISSKDNKKKIFITFNYFVIEYYSFESFKLFLKDVEEIFINFIKVYEPIDIKRLGLRYINKIVFKKGDPYRWSDYIVSSLTKNLESFIDKKNKKYLSRILNQIYLNYDDHMMQFTYGIHNPEFPAKVSRKEFLLDYDCYTTDVETSMTMIIEKLNMFNLEILKLFLKSIKSQLRKKMGETDD